MTELKIQHNLVSHYNSVPADDEWLCEFLDVFTAPLDPAARASAREAIEAGNSIAVRRRDLIPTRPNAGEYYIVRPVR
jgi:hypothetical protein